MTIVRVHTCVIASPEAATLPLPFGSGREGGCAIATGMKKES